MKFPRMPGWAVSLSVSLVATCIAILAMANVYAQAHQHREAVFKACAAQVRSSSLVIDVFGRLRDADLTILDVTSASVANQPTTPAGHAIVSAVQKQITAYDDLLFAAAQGQKVDCSTLR